MAAPKNPTWLTHEEALRMFSYDPETGIVTTLVPRGQGGSYRPPGSAVGGATGRGYVSVLLFGRYVLLHRLIWFLHTGAWPSGQIDHIDRDRTNNRFANLRDVTHAENGRNRMGRGVSWHKASSRWRAQIKVDGKLVHLGLFVCIGRARKAYLDAKRHHHPEAFS